MNLTDDWKNDRGGAWVNIYKEEDKDIFWTGSTGYSTEEIAKHNICDKRHRIATIDIKAAIENYNELQRLKEKNKILKDNFNHLNEALNIELLSDRIHILWSNWFLHQRDLSTKDNLARWDKQAHTRYENLSDADKEKDRKIVKNLLFETLNGESEK